MGRYAQRSQRSSDESTSSTPLSIRQSHPADATVQRTSDTSATGGEMPHSIGGLGAAERLERVRARTESATERTPNDPSSDKHWHRGAPTSLQRTAATRDTGPAGETQVPDSVRDVISSPGRSLDPSIQRAMEGQMGDSLGDVRIHTGPKAAQACEQINARAFTVGNHVAFNSGEYDPESPEGQHVLAHELAHVRQQTGGAVSMLPQEDLGLEIDPDPQLEREAEETAQQVIRGGELGIQRLGKTDVHIQRSIKNRASSLKDRLFGKTDEASLSLNDIDEQSGVDERLSALAENQKQLQAKVDELSATLEGNIFQKMSDAGTGEALKIGMTEAGKKSGLPFGQIMGSLSGAALQAIYNNRKQVLEALGLKSESSLDKVQETGLGDSTGDAKSRRD
ncbi:DUF4157 domain-containing protein [Natrinema hispanicum]|uniref:eCIS core domain-containing protein n=1 Tax=Natrinema hispanicum TaxID=392421 RepID=A0A1I0BLL4_9EURY|nr:DUF4157 domain-containing protein [Natrinema hispanicum]SDC33389.1 protein of unknown function [Natrinema hispanicum]SET07161.1 protein of unknown function [Natrinema hispanicum]